MSLLVGQSQRPRQFLSAPRLGRERPLTMHKVVLLLLCIVVVSRPRRSVRGLLSCVLSMSGVPKLLLLDYSVAEAEA